MPVRYLVGHSLPRFWGNQVTSRKTTSGIEVQPVYEERREPSVLGAPGEFPYARGPYASMYRGRPWTMRQYAGFGTAEATNERFHALLEAGQTGLSVAFDLPTQMGLDSDDPMALGEVGKVGVAIDTLDDMRMLLDGLPLGEVSTSMTINSTAPILLLMYQLVAEERGIDPHTLRGTVQNDILKEYIARGTYIYPPRPSMRLVTDLFTYCAKQIPNWNTISISGYHIREAGASASQELAYTIANGLAYVEAAQAAGLDVDVVAPRLSFFWNAHNDFFEEIAKFRAARRMWAHLMRDRVGATAPASHRMRFHTQTAGSTLTAQQPQNNIVRTSYQAMAAVLGGTQSLHTNAFDEALGLPTENSATIALRTQQILALETGVTATVDPLAGSYFVESLTDELQAAAERILDEIDDLGGAVLAIEEGYQARGIEDAAYAHARAMESKAQLVVGVNAHESADELSVPVSEVDPSLEREQTNRLSAWRVAHPNAKESAREVSAIAGTDANVLYSMKDALTAGATVGEISNALKSVFGVYRPGY